MNSGAERGARPALEGMYMELETMRERQGVLWAEYEALVQDCDAVKQAIEVLERRAADNGQESPPVAAPPASPGPVSLDGCRNTDERLVRMAQEWGGVVNCNDAADLLIGLSISTGKRSNLVSALQQRMKDKDSIWEYVGPRTYRYRLYRGAHDGASSDSAGSGAD